MDLDKVIEFQHRQLLAEVLIGNAANVKRRAYMLKRLYELKSLSLGLA